MSQTYTDDCYFLGMQATTSLQAFEDNFAALKSAFSGVTAPGNTVAGMWWYDTTAHILRVRNEDNTAWLSVWDLANNKPVVANIVPADFAAAMKDAVAATASLRTLGTTGTSACAGNDSRLSDTRTPAGASVTQSKLKTSQGSVNYTATTGSTGMFYSCLTLPGGEYGFYVQTYNTTNKGEASIGVGSSSYRTNIKLGAYSSVVYSTVSYARQRYVTSSGEVFWVFILRDKVTKDIISMYQAPDHPCFGNGGKPLLVSHPFGTYDSETQEIIVINPSHEEVEAMKKKGERGEDEPDKDLLEVIMEEYEIDEESKPAWPTTAVTVGLPKDYEMKKMGEKVETIKKVIPKMSHLTAKSLRKKR